MAHKWHEIQDMPDEQLIAGYDAAAEHTSGGLNYWRDELLHRQQMRAAQAQWEQADDVRRLTVELRDLTKEVRDMTSDIRALTATMKTIANRALVISGTAVVVSLLAIFASRGGS